MMSRKWWRHTLNSRHKRKRMCAFLLFCWHKPDYAWYGCHRGMCEMQFASIKIKREHEINVMSTVFLFYKLKIPIAVESEFEHLRCIKVSKMLKLYMSQELRRSKCSIWFISLVTIEPYLSVGFCHFHWKVWQIRCANVFRFYWTLLLCCQRHSSFFVRRLLSSSSLCRWNLN